MSLNAIKVELFFIFLPVDVLFATVWWMKILWSPLVKRSVDDR